MSNPEQNKQTLNRLYQEVINNGNIDFADEIMREDRPDHEPSLPPEMLDGRLGFKKAIAFFRSVAPDIHFDAQFMIAEGDYVMAYARVTGTQTGDMMGYPASGKSFDVQSIDICRFDEKGLIAEHWGGFDMLSLLKQIGATQ